MGDWPRPQFGSDDWELLATNRLADGFFQLEQLTLMHRGYQAESIGPMRRELFVRTPAVVVILCDVARKQLVMVEQQLQLSILYLHQYLTQQSVAS